MDKKFSAVVVGCGAIGPVHADVIGNCAQASVYGVCDVIKDRAERLAEKEHCRIYDSFEDVLSDRAVEVVHICTPHYLHAPMVKAAVRAGKHVVVEKPVAMNKEEAEALAAEITHAKSKVCCILQNRYTPCIQKMKQLIESGEYGAVKGGRGLLTWQRTAEYYNSAPWRGLWDTEGGGLLINQAVHLLDLLTFLGGECVSLEGSIANRTLQNVIEVEDTAEATIYTKENKVLHFFATNGYCENTPFDLEIVLDEAALRFMDGRLFLRKNGITKEIASNLQPKVGKAYWGSGHQTLIDAFYCALQGGEAEYTSMQDGVSALRLVDGIYRSAKKGGRIQIG